jgi:hypothetical protein
VRIQVKAGAQPFFVELSVRVFNTQYHREIVGLNRRPGVRLSVQNVDFLLTNQIEPQIPWPVSLSRPSSLH